MRDDAQPPAPIDANAFNRTFAAYLAFEAAFDAVPVASDREAAALARFESLVAWLEPAARARLAELAGAFTRAVADASGAIPEPQPNS